MRRSLDHPDMTVHSETAREGQNDTPQSNEAGHCLAFALNSRCSSFAALMYMARVSLSMAFQRSKARREAKRAGVSSNHPLKHYTSNTHSMYANNKNNGRPLATPFGRALDLACQPWQYSMGVRPILKLAQVGSGGQESK